MTNEWTKAEHAIDYLGRAEGLPHRAEGESVLVEEILPTTRRVLDLGTGDGRLMNLVLGRCPNATGLAVDFSPAMLERARERFADNPNVEVIEHDLSDPLPDWGTFDAIVSSLAIHHLEDQRKRELYGEIFAALEPGGTFCNFEHVSSTTDYRHRQFLDAINMAPADEDPSNRLVDVETQLTWLRELGFADVDCTWKYREVALMVAIKPQ